MADIDHIRLAYPYGTLTTYHKILRILAHRATQGKIEMFSKCLTVLLLLFLMTGCAPNTVVPAQQRIVYGLTLEPSGFDPHIHRSAELGIVLRQVYDTLLYRDLSTKEFVPGLATAWTISEDNLTYTFTLRQGVTFHDGTAFNAQAVAANLDRVTSPETASQNAVFMLGPYTGNEIVDDYTIRIHLAEPYTPLLDALSQVYLSIASPTAFQQYSTNRYQFHQVGTGPFTFVEYISGDHITLQRNPSYTWGPAFYLLPNEKSLDEIEFRFFTDAPTRSLALENGQAQIMGELSPIDATALRGNSEIRLLPTNIPGQPLQFLININRPPTDNLIVRQALLFGTNRSVIVDTVYQGFSSVAWGPLAANTLFSSRELRGAYAHDPGQAQSLLASVGYQDSNNDGYLEDASGNLEATIIVPSWGLVPEVSQLLQDQWRTLGIKAVLEPVPGFSALQEKIKAGKYNLVAFDTWGLDPYFLNRYFLSDGDNNWTGFSNVELDNILREAVRQTDNSIRQDLYIRAQRIIMENALILPIRDYVNLNATGASVQGLAYDPYGWFPILNNVTLSS
jgi:peptide/nickel transport system substrate-binding protein